jgi:hypothetical protein
MTNRAWQVHERCPTTGDGLYEDRDWLSKQIDKKFSAFFTNCVRLAIRAEKMNSLLGVGFVLQGKLIPTA